MNKSLDWLKDNFIMYYLYYTFIVVLKLYSTYIWTVRIPKNYSTSKTSWKEWLTKTSSSKSLTLGPLSK